MDATSEISHEITKDDISEMQKELDAQIKEQMNENDIEIEIYDETDSKTPFLLSIEPPQQSQMFQEYCYNDLVRLEDKRTGTIKFIGTLGLNTETWIGLILDEPTGSHNGTVKTRSYWTCKENHGTFVKRNQLKSVEKPRSGDRFAINEKVKTPKGKGWIRFIGEIPSYTFSQTKILENESSDEIATKNSDNTKNENQVIYGIELIHELGENSGSYNHEYYFICAHYRGVFYRESDLIYVPPDAPATPRAPKRKKNKKSRRNHVEFVAESDELINIDPSLISRISGCSQSSMNSTEMTDDDDDYSDSSEDGEFLTTHDMRKISLLSNNDRMSFARILTDFKSVQESHVRSMASRWEKKLVTTRWSDIKHTHVRDGKTEVDIAKEVISVSRSKRADTMPVDFIPPSYVQPKFADDLIKTSKFIKNKSNKKGSQSNPTSPMVTPLKNRTRTDRTESTATNFKANFARPQARGRKPQKKKRKKGLVTFDEDDSKQDVSLAHSKSCDVFRIDENRQIEATGAFDGKSTNNNDQSIVNEQANDATTNDSSNEEIQKKKRGMSVPLSNVGTKPPALMPLGSDKSDKSDKTDSGEGYASPGFISPGGGMPSLMLQNSASADTDAAHNEIIAVVPDSHTKDLDIAHVSGADELVRQDTGGSEYSNQGIPLKVPKGLSPISSDVGDIPETTPIIGPLSPTAMQVYSWVFKPADSEDKETKRTFSLKDEPDSPFDVSSTKKDFTRCAEVLMLGCNNPKNLFKVLKGVCAKLRLPQPKYRKIDSKNRAVQQKLLRFEGADDFLQLLGFEQSDNNSYWVCASDQPPVSVLNNAIDVCNDCIMKCNQKRTTIDMIKKFSKNNLKKGKKGGKRRSRKGMGKKQTKMRKSKTEGDVLKFKSKMKAIECTDPDGTPNGATLRSAASQKVAVTPPSSMNINLDALDITDLQDESSTLSVPSPTASSSSLIAPGPAMTLDAAGRTLSLRLEDATETIDDAKFEDELESDADRFQLSDIIWSITHRDNTDKDAKKIILLCFPTFSTHMKLLKCLAARFFADSDDLSRHRRKGSTSYSSTSFEPSTTLSSNIPSPKAGSSSARTFDFDSEGNKVKNYVPILSSWEVQVKVVSFIQQWMRTYWNEDWHDNDDVQDYIETFCDTIEHSYKSDNSYDSKDVKKGMKLIKMIHQSMDFQEANHRMQKKKLFARQNSVGIGSDKFNMLTGMKSTVSKTRNGFVKIDNTKIAQQITLMDFKCFCDIKKRECLGQSWKKPNKYHIAGNICALIDEFNKMSKWVQATILLAKNVKRRGRLIKKFIKISNELYKLRNFQSLCAFHGALTSVPIHRLKHAWNYVPTKHVARFEEMRVIFNTRNNMANLRKLHREAHAPLVPYTGIFLSDLVSIEEGNKKKKDDGSVNFAKLMRLSNSIDSILLYQTTAYEFEDDPAIQNLLLDDFKLNEKLDSDYIYQFSSDVARNDTPKRNRSRLFGNK